MNLSLKTIILDLFQTFRISDQSSEIAENLEFICTQKFPNEGSTCNININTILNDNSLKDEEKGFGVFVSLARPKRQETLI